MRTQARNALAPSGQPAIPTQTVETHVSNIVERLRVKNRAEAVAVARTEQAAPDELS